MNPWQVKKNVQVYTLPETKIFALKMDGWKMHFLVGWPMFKGLLLLVSGNVNSGVFPTSVLADLSQEKQDHQIQKLRNHF